MLKSPNWNKQWMVDFYSRKTTKIRNAYGKFPGAEGRGNVKVKVKNGKIVRIKDVWYGPSMKRNLMSVGKLIEKGFLVTMKNSLLNLYNSNKKLIMQSKKGRNRTFKVDVETNETKCLCEKGIEGASYLWHKILGHLNFRSLWHFNYKKLVYFIPKIVKLEKSYEICMKGNQPRLPFESQVAPRVKHALRVVHSDVCGPFEVPSLRGNNYFVSFVYEFARMTRVALMKLSMRCLLSFRSSR